MGVAYQLGRAWWWFILGIVPVVAFVEGFSLFHRAEQTIIAHGHVTVSRDDLGILVESSDVSPQHQFETTPADFYYRCLTGADQCVADVVEKGRTTRKAFKNLAEAEAAGAYQNLPQRWSEFSDLAVRYYTLTGGKGQFHPSIPEPTSEAARKHQFLVAYFLRNSMRKNKSFTNKTQDELVLVDLRKEGPSPAPPDWAKYEKQQRALVDADVVAATRRDVGGWIFTISFLAAVMMIGICPFAPWREAFMRWIAKTIKNVGQKPSTAKPNK